MPRNYITIDTRCQTHYASYYIMGVKAMFPNAKIKWDAKKFGYHITDFEEYRKGVGIIIPAPIINSRFGCKLNKDLNVYIDFNDFDSINDKFLKWADVYAKVNARFDDRHLNKLLPIGPSFGILWQNKIQATCSSLINYINQRNLPGFKISPKEFLRGYFYPFARRCNYGEYTKNSTAKEDYCFAMSTLWYDSLTDTTTNRWRGVFMKKAKAIIPNFEGGFFFIDNPGVELQFPKYKEYRKEFSDIITTARIPMNDYLQKTRESEFVFNTPSVVGCHGWKLAEYLAMGKAIISTSINHCMPGEFIAGKHYLEVRSEEELESAVVMLHSNIDLRIKLEKAAKEYFTTYLAPEKVIERIIQKGLSIFNA